MTISEVLSNITSLAVDTAPFIYFLEKNPTYFEQMREIFQHIEEHKVQIIASTLILTEVLVKPIKVENKTLQTAYIKFLTANSAIRLMNISDTIAIQAAELRSKYNLKTPDALHIASAIVSKADAFLTNDDGFKRVTEIPIILLSDIDVEPDIEE